jgi:hypothetical protein
LKFTQLFVYNLLANFLHRAAALLTTKCDDRFVQQPASLVEVALREMALSQSPLQWPAKLDELVPLHRQLESLVKERHGLVNAKLLQVAVASKCEVFDGRSHACRILPSTLPVMCEQKDKFLIVFTTLLTILIKDVLLALTLIMHSS